MAVKKVLLDTCFLIAVVNDKSNHHDIAVKYYKYFINKGFEMYLSTIVISEFHQKQSVVKLMSMNSFLTLPYNYHDAVATADVCFQLGMAERVEEQPKAEFKDDLKLLGQARENGMDYIITEDEKTLALYAGRLKKANLLESEIIKLKDGFQEAHFNNGQTALV